MNTSSAVAQRGWREAITSFAHPRAIAMLFLGFAAGLPFLLVFSTLSAWLSEAEVSRSTIGFFSWVGITYSVKVLWAPVIDRLPVPYFTRALGRRRSWMLVAQAGIAVGLIGMAGTDPAGSLAQLALFAVLVAFASATQDVSIDAYRIEAAIPEMQGVLSATYITGYRLGLLAAGAGAFYIAEYWSWPTVYLSMAALMLVGMITVLVISEPVRNVVSVASTAMANAANGWQRLAIWFYDAVLCPFLDFFRRHGHWALLILVFIGIYRISDITMGVMANPFYLELGYSKVDIANVGKVYGFFMSIGGAAVGGLLVVRYGVMRILLLGAILVCSTNLLFAWLATQEPRLELLALVISADNLSGGLAASAFIAYLSSLTSTAYTATQYALFSSLMTLPAKFLGGFSGIIVDTAGYGLFFVYASALGIPAIALVIVLMRAGRNREGQEPTSSTA